MQSQALGGKYVPGRNRCSQIKYFHEKIVVKESTDKSGRGYFSNLHHGEKENEEGKGRGEMEEEQKEQEINKNIKTPQAGVFDGYSRTLAPICTSTYLYIQLDPL